MSAYGCHCSVCPPPPRKLRKCWLRKRYRAHRREHVWYPRWVQRVHIVDGIGVARSATLQQFTGHRWVNVRPLEIRDGVVIVSENAPKPLAPFMKEI